MRRRFLLPAGVATVLFLVLGILRFLFGNGVLS